LPFSNNEKLCHAWRGKSPCCLSLLLLLTQESVKFSFRFPPLSLSMCNCPHNFVDRRRVVLAKVLCKSINVESSIIELAKPKQLSKEDRWISSRDKQREWLTLTITITRNFATDRCYRRFWFFFNSHFRSV
jgi:hypothetical protein